MAFTSGQKILAADYNGLITRLNDINAVGTGDAGYGASAISSKASPPPYDITTKVQNEDWLAIRDDIFDAGTHQGAVPPLPLESDIEDGDIIQAFTLLDSGITTITNNRLNVDAANTTVDASVLTDERIADWSNQIKHTFTADFGTDNDARQFFNTGGQIRLTMTAPDDAAAHNWGGLYTTSGTFIFDHNSYYTLSSTINNSINLTVSSAGAAAYSIAAGANTWTVAARFIAGTSTNGARGSTLEISSTSTDVYSGHPSFPGSPDIVSGTFTSTIGERRSTIIYNSPSPSYATVVSLVDGS